MADEPSSGVAELKAVVLDLLHPGARPPRDAHAAPEQGPSPMAEHAKHDRPQPADTADTATSGKPAASGKSSGLPAASDRGRRDADAPARREGGNPGQVAGRAGGRDDASLNASDDRPEEYGTGADSRRTGPDADRGDWPPRDWDGTGDGGRQRTAGKEQGPGGYEDRSQELHDYGPGPKGSTGEAWRTYEHHRDGNPGADDQGAPRKDKPQGSGGKK